MTTALALVAALLTTAAATYYTLGSQHDDTEDDAAWLERFGAGEGYEGRHRG